MIIGIVAGSGSDNTGNTTVTSTGNQVQETVYNIGDAISKDLYQLLTAASEASIASSYIKKNYYK